MKAWTTKEEAFIHDNIGVLSINDIANILGRTYGATKNRICKMRNEGKIDYKSNICDIEYETKLTICCECGYPRATCNDEDVCKVCRDRKRLNNHIDKMYKSYDNLPIELKRRTHERFDITRNKRLMSKSLNLKRPPYPSLYGLDDYYKAVRLDRWYEELEQYELAILKLDIDVVKQRRSKWNRKSKKFRETK